MLRKAREYTWRDSLRTIVWGWALKETLRPTTSVTSKPPPEAPAEAPALEPLLAREATPQLARTAVSEYDGA